MNLRGLQREIPGIKASGRGVKSIFRQINIRKSPQNKGLNHRKIGCIFTILLIKTFTFINVKLFSRYLCKRVRTPLLLHYCKQFFTLLVVQSCKNARCDFLTNVNVKFVASKKLKKRPLFSRIEQVILSAFLIEKRAILKACFST